MKIIYSKDEVRALVVADVIKRGLMSQEQKYTVGEECDANYDPTGAIEVDTEPE